MKYFFTLFFITSLSLGVFGQEKKYNLTYKLDEYFTALTNLKNFNGNVIVSKRGQILLNKTYNIVGETDSLRVIRDSKFIIASVSKVFIKFSILRLADLKRLRLTDRLSKFIPGFPSGDKITIEQLLHHQSGLPRELTNKEAYNSLSLVKTVELAKLEKLQFEPGTETLYSNIGYSLLHYIIDKTSKNGYFEFLQDEVLNKMKLNNTMEFNSGKVVPNFAYGFDNENGKVIPTSKESISRFETGNYLSTINDLYSFSQQILSGKIVKKPLALKMFGPDSVLIQAGGRSGYRAYFYKNLKTDVTFILVSNYTEIPFQEVTTDIINIVDHKPYVVPQKIYRVEIELPIETLKKYTGKFALVADLAQTFSLEIIGNKLFHVDPDGEKSELHPDSERTFFESPTSKDGYIFTLNQQTNQYDLTIISTGLILKTKRLE